MSMTKGKSTAPIFNKVSEATEEAKALTKHFGGNWNVACGSAPCPICQTERRSDQNALSLCVANGILLIHCFKNECAFKEIIRASGLPKGAFKKDSVAQKEIAANRDELAAKKQAVALNIWKEAEPSTGTLAEDYLRARGIDCSLPLSLKFHSACWHGPTNSKVPAMVAAVTIGSQPVGIHRTFLFEPGRKAFGKKSKMMLGPCTGGSVHLSKGTGPLIVAEGIETGLSILSKLLEINPSVWAALGTSGMTGLILPDQPGDLVIAPDGDSPGRRAAKKLAHRATLAGWIVRIMPCPDGKDWNDLTQEVTV